MSGRRILIYFTLNDNKFLVIERNDHPSERHIFPARDSISRRNSRCYHGSNSEERMQPAATCNKANAISNPKNGILVQMLSLHVGTACQPVGNYPSVKLLLGSSRSAGPGLCRDRHGLHSPISYNVILNWNGDMLRGYHERKAICNQ